MAALALIAVAGLGYAAHAAAHGDWRALGFAAFLALVYGAVWLADLSIRRPARPARKFRSF